MLFTLLIICFISFCFVSHIESNHQKYVIAQIKETEKAQNAFLAVLKQNKTSERFALTKYNK